MGGSALAIVAPRTDIAMQTPLITNRTDRIACSPRAADGMLIAVTWGPPHEADPATAARYAVARPVEQAARQRFALSA